MLNEIKDVHASMWISASAGTGKTKSLIDRILALLLNGARPSGILCLTYTKAAATEMSTRLTRYLQKWSLMSDAELSAELEALGFDDSLKETARNLYAKTTSTEWVTIQTIHSFCLGLLEKFPLETGLFPNIEICSDYQYEQLITEAINYVIADDSYLSEFENIAEYECDISDFLKAFGMNIKRFIDKHNDFKQLYSKYFNTENIPVEKENVFLFAKLFNNEHQKIFAELAEELSKGGKLDNDKAEILRTNAQNPTEAFVGAFLNQKGEIFKNLCSKELSALRPRMEEIAVKAQLFLSGKAKLTATRANASLFTIIKAVFRKFEELKRLHHCLDYNDIILNALILLENIDWVMYKTDGGLDHILIDEAQDTSPEQWELIKKITEEFFSNYQTGKTLFVVGDEKQSIYSFQGADIRLFKKMHEYFKTAAERSGQKFYDVELKKSYRSLGNVLTFVDEVFRDIFHTHHETNRDIEKGVVDIVDAFQDDEEVENIDNAVPAEKKLAVYIANYIKHAITIGVEVGAEKRAARPSDFLILFQRRKSEMIYPIINALKAENIPVAEIDRVRLKEELIVEDLIALAEFAVFPLDDLMCARVLKSPVVGMTEEDLMAACLERKEEHLWHYLQQSEWWQKYHLETLEFHIKQAHSVSVYDFFMNILTDGILEKFISRLGDKILETLYEFLDVVMQYEKTNTASLSSFLAWFRSFNHEMKKESFGNENVVRLMTAHASKGLQAPFVIVADAQFMKSAQQIDKILKDDETGILFWNFSSQLQAKEVLNLYEAKKKAEDEESDRLMYVALTRAENYLCVLGKHGKNKSTNEKSWLSKMLTASTKFKESSEFGQNTHRFGNYERGHALEITEKTLLKPEIPSWFNEKLALPQAEEIEENIETPQIIYGNYIHLLLSELPKYPHEIANDIATELSANFNLSNAEISKAIAEAKDVFKKHSFLFSQNSDAEVPFVFEGKEGRIDRLVEHNGNIWIVDFKTGAPQYTPPREYVEQLKIYKQAVSAIKNVDFSQIKTALLWTANAALAEIFC
ncbi:MAG: UvrD-helicase domain-containing protein [Alphaproteobacteria bacterium]|nr:UvrD-helicase domain-containing protein [Alphaproteobacteria bacterium]